MEIRIGDFKTTDRIRSYINEILDNGRLTEGPFTERFEEKVKGILGIDNALAVTNGTVSLQLIGQYLKMKHGKLKVCVPALTFPATLNAFLIVGHDVVLCDVGDDLLIDIGTLSEEEKESIDVIVPVHLMGYSADMESIMEAAKKYGWIVIEDTAEAFGGEYKGRKLGTIGDFGSFSFYVSHNITGGELGLITTKDPKTAKIFNSMKKHGRDFDSPLEFRHPYVGSNYKTTEFCSAVALAHLDIADELLNKRFSTARYYYENIKNPMLEPFPVTQGFSPLGYPIRCKSEKERDMFCKRLNAEGIETRHIFPNLMNQEAYAGMLHGKYPVSDRLEKTVFYIGVHHLLKEEDKKKIVEVLNRE